MTVLISGFLVVGILFSALNWSSIYFSWRDKRFHSPVPIFGAWFLGLGLAGFQATRPFWWLCFILDYGTFALILAMPAVLHEAWSTCRINRLHQFYALENGRETTISLFRHGHAIVQMKFDATYRDKVRGGPVAVSRPCKWHMADSIYELDGLGDERVLRLKPSAGQLVCEDAPALADDLYHDKLGGVIMLMR